MNGYQICSKCEGTGKRYNIIPTGYAMFDVAMMLPSAQELLTGKKNDDTCPVCNGKMIISTETGLPPNN